MASRVLWATRTASLLRIPSFRRGFASEDSNVKWSGIGHLKLLENVKDQQSS